MSFFFDKDLSRKQLDPKSVRTIKARGGVLMASEMSFKAGGIGAIHDHPHEQIVYVLEGEMDFTLGEDTKRVRAGDSVYVPSGLRHGAVAITDARLLDIFTPQREDFL